MVSEKMSCICGHDHPRRMCSHCDCKRYILSGCIICELYPQKGSAWTCEKLYQEEDMKCVCGLLLSSHSYGHPHDCGKCPEWSVGSISQMQILATILELEEIADE